MTASQPPVRVRLAVESTERRSSRATATDLPPGYRAVARALARYLRRIRAVDRGTPLRGVIVDATDLLAHAAVEGASIRQTIGQDAAEFADALARNYGPTRRARVARDRLEGAVDRIEPR